MQRTRGALAYLAAAVLATAGARAHAQQPETSGSTPSSTRATVVELPPAAEDQGIVRLSTAATAEDVIQPVLEIERGKTVLLKPAYDVKRIAVGDPEIVDFVVNGSNEIQLIAKSVGNTNVLIWDSGNRLQASIDIHVGAVRAQLVRELRRVLGRNDVSVDMAGEAVVLRGTVPDLQTSEAAEAVATAFFASDDAGGGAAAGAAAAPAKEKRVINLLSVGGNQQVMLQVIVAELSRTVSRAIGSNFTIINDGRKDFTATSLIRGLISLPPAGSMTNDITVSNFVDLAVTLVDRDGDAFALFLESLEANSLAKVLAEPRLVARSGQLASFLAGGEIPIPVPQGGDDNTITIQFKRFGVQLEFIPTVLSADRIHLQVTPEVSQPTQDSIVSFAGTSVPSFTTRRVATGVELADGQSFMIGGLLQDRVTADYERFPLLGSVPVLGNLFRSERFMRNESELVVIVTPRLVQPLGPGPLALPTDRYREPGPLAFYLLGRINARPPAPPVPPAEAGSNAEPSEPKGEAVAAGPTEGLIGEFGHQLRLRQPQGDQ